MLIASEIILPPTQCPEFNQHASLPSTKHMRFNFAVRKSIANSLSLSLLAL